MFTYMILVNTIIISVSFRIHWHVLWKNKILTHIPPKKILFECIIKHIIITILPKVVVKS